MIRCNHAQVYPVFDQTRRLFLIFIPYPCRLFATEGLFEPGVLTVKYGTLISTIVTDTTFSFTLSLKVYVIFKLYKQEFES